MGDKLIKEEVSIWQFLGFLSILIAIFSSYVREKDRIIVFFVFFLGVIVYSIYKIYLQNKNIFLKIIKKENQKYSYRFLSIPFILEIIDIILIWFLLGLVLNLFTLDSNNQFSTILKIFIICGYLFFHSKNTNYVQDDQYKHNLNFIFGILCNVVLLFLLRFFENSSNIFLYFISLTSNVILFLILILVLKSFYILFQMIFNNQKYKKVRIKKNLILNWRKVICISLALFFCIICMIFIFSGLPFKYPIEQSAEKCNLVKKYDLSANAFLLHNYRGTVPVSDLTKIEFKFYGILQKDGDFTKINLLNESLDKTYLQYFDVGYIEDKKLNLAIFTFKDKNIEYLDKIEVVTKKKIC